MIKAFEVRNDLDAIFCANQQEVDLVVEEWTRQAKVIGHPTFITVANVEIRGFIESEQVYIERLRKLKNEERP